MTSFFYAICITSLWFLALSGVGLMLTSQTTMKKTTQIISGFGLGYLLWVILMYLAPSMVFRNLSSILFMILGGGSLFYNRFDVWNCLKKLFSTQGLLILILSLMWVTPVLASGWKFDNGHRFYGVNAHDGVWHAALVSSLADSNSRNLPTYAEKSLSGYHYLVDLSAAELVRLFAVDNFHLIFRVYPFIFSIIILIGIVNLFNEPSLKCLEIKQCNRKIAAYTSILLVVFGGSLAYVLPLFGLASNISESAFWMHQGISSWINLPLGVSFAFIIIMINVLINLFAKPSTILALLLATLVGGQIGIKAYGGVLALVLASVACFYLMRKKYFRQALLICMLTGSIFSLLYLTNLSPNAAGFIWEPGWFVKTMFEASDRVNWPRWELLRQSFFAKGNILFLSGLWFAGVAIFILGNMGSRLIGYATIIKRRDYLTVTLFVMTSVAMVLPLLFIQKGVSWNAIQFGYYAYYILSILTGLLLLNLTKTKSSILAIIIVLTSIPTTVISLADILTKHKAEEYYLISDSQFDILSALRQLPNGVVVSPYEDKAMVPAFSGKLCYFCNQTQSDLLLFDTKELLAEMHILFSKPLDPELITSYMNRKSITYLYLPDSNSETSQLLKKHERLTLIRESGAASIFKYQQ